MSTEVENSLRAQIMEQRFTALEVSNAANTARITQLTMEKERALVWGIVTLGALVLGMVVWIFNLITGHAK